MMFCGQKKKKTQTLVMSTFSSQPSEPPGPNKNSLRQETLKTYLSHCELGHFFVSSPTKFWIWMEKISQGLRDESCLIFGRSENMAIFVRKSGLTLFKIRMSHIKPVSLFY